VPVFKEENIAANTQNYDRWVSYDDP